MPRPVGVVVHSRGRPDALPTAGTATYFPGMGLRGSMRSVEETRKARPEPPAPACSGATATETIHEPGSEAAIDGGEDAAPEP